MLNKIQIAIDGPAGSGKSTIAKIIAKKFKFIYIDTGAMYRAVTLYAKIHNVSYQDEKKISTFVDNIPLKFIPGYPVQHVLIEGKDVTKKIRSNDITNNVSLVSSFKEVRKIMTSRQREMAEKNNVVMDGRDIGVTVLPNAQIKIFLTASLEARVKRRLIDNRKKGINESFNSLKNEIIKRDYKDSHRLLSPLKKAKDAIEIDTTDLTIKQVIKRIISIINIFFKNNNYAKKKY